uniref:PiggyBac transposable element-derived protein domain-containing protein n=1 Tax=Clastoptera arizonana TaxID=38151 RepID=A0A1B6DQT8_9HEMI
MNRIIKHSNEEIDRIRGNYYAQTSYTGPLGLEEMKAFLAVLVNSAVSKDNHLSVRELFDSEYSRSCYKSIMSSDRFEFLVTCLRFDAKETRIERKKLTLLLP